MKWITCSNVMVNEIYSEVFDEILFAELGKLMTYSHNLKVTKSNIDDIGISL